MNINIRSCALSALLVGTTVVAIGCGGDSGSDTGDGANPGRERAASVSGTVSYNERLALTPEAKLIVELLDTSYADAPSEVIASQIIGDPGQVCQCSRALTHRFHDD